MKTKLASLAVVLVAALAPGVRAADAAPKVHIENFQFRPQTLEVPVGATVVWVNDDEEIHALYAMDDSFRSPALDGDASFEHQFTKAGTYEYRCSLHPQMKGTIVVR
ncbi:MAG TPA: cupredoxin family copper-binding protein [Myxococcota bacterium]|nr:cupredoxin family copper-binding protein [Myxococcota bacterium]